MERVKSRADVAVFIDFENVYVSVREKFDAQPNFELIMDRCEDYGRIVISRAYADWYRYPRVTSALFANGVEPMYVPTYHYDREMGRTGRPIKNSVDIHLCIDAMRTLYTQTHIDKFVLVTGDRDFIPLVNAIRQHGKDVIIIGIGGAASAHLAQSGDEFLFYEQIADLKPPQQQRQEQQQRPEQSGRGDRRERGERSERSERGERGERGERDGVKAETNGKPEGKRDRTAERSPSTPEQIPEPMPEAQEPAAASERTVYDTLVDAINLARQRGFVSNLGSLKVLMRELDSAFHESKVKDGNGRPFSKFKDFVKEAERQGKVQMFTNGTVTEVFLPGEDPLRVSQFAEDLASQAAERELESELAQQEADEESQAELQAQPEAVAPTPTDEQPVLPGIVEEQAQPEPAAATSAVEEQPADAEETKQTFGEREWKIFQNSMSEFMDPVRFAEIFSALRGLRNQEVFDLTNNELKEMVKQAINRGMLQRTGRGARAYYRLSSQYRVAGDDRGEERTRSERRPAAPQAEAPEVDTTVETAAGQASDDGLAASERRRRGRTYDYLSSEATLDATAAEAPTAEPTATTTVQSGLELQDTVADLVAAQTQDEPAPTKPRRNRRKKAPATAETAAPAEAAPVAEAAPGADETPAEGSADEAPAAPRKRRSRRKKAPAAGENGGADESGEE